MGWGGVRLLSQTSPIPRSPDGDNKDFYCNGGDDDGKVFISIGLSIMAKVRRPIGCLKCTDSQLSEDDHIIPGRRHTTLLLTLFIFTSP